MNVQQLKTIIESLPDDYEGVGIDDVFSWRGSYCEPAFCITENTTKGTMLEVLDHCLASSFEGYKGGTYYYYLHSNVNFECDESSYTDGLYLEDWLNKAEGNEFINRVDSVLYI